MKIGFVICTRTDSERLPNKPFRKVNGVPIIKHLIERLKKTNIPVYLAFPRDQSEQYLPLAETNSVHLFAGDHYDNPLGRMHQCAIENRLDFVIRVSHDKILVDPDNVLKAVELFVAGEFDYLYGASFIPGTGFEIIKVSTLDEAAKTYKNVEYIGYAIRSVTTKTFNFSPKHPRGSYRFLIDYESDLKLFDVMFSTLGNDCSLKECIKYLDKNSELKQISRQPLLTIYTCAHNAEKYLTDCFDSVTRQVGFKDFEYILIDDHSTDSTCEMMAKLSINHSNVSWLRNEKNIGLASSSNIALKKARGKYIMRLDADDYFVSVHAISEMIQAISNQDLEAVYPDNYFGDLNFIQNGSENHHAGGAIFLKDALNHIKFTDGLRGHDSLDVYVRARDKLKIGYIKKPMFFYRQHDKSLTKNNLAERKKLKDLILMPIHNPFEDDFDVRSADVGFDISQ